MADIDVELQTPAETGAEPAPETKPESKSNPLQGLFGSGKAPRKKKTLLQEVLDWIITIAAALVIAFVVRSFIFEPVRVDGNSMYPTLHHNEIMYVSKTDYGSSFFGIPFTNIGIPFTVGGNPDRFDVVVCNYPDRYDARTGRPTNFVKRIVGIPGDVIEVRGGYLFVNGQMYREKFLHERMLGSFGPYTVPDGHYFLMGDNRNNSNDSRSPSVGAVPRSMIVGRVEAVLWHDIPATLEDANLR